MSIDIRGLRRRLKLSQKALADQLRLTQSTISRLESGRRKIDGPTAIVLEQLDGSAPAEVETTAQ